MRDTATYDQPCRWTGLVEKSDERTAAQRLADVLSESHREDTSAEFRLGLLQGALAVALPEWLQTTAPYIGAVNVNRGALTKEQIEAIARRSTSRLMRAAREALARVDGKATKRSRRHA